MHIWVPRAMWRYKIFDVPRQFSGLAPTEPIPSPIWRAAMGVSSDYDQYDDQLFSYFYDTNGRFINDCVHSKLVDGPNSIATDGIIYPRHLRYGHEINWDCDPMSESWKIKSHPFCLLVNRGKIGYIIEPQISKSSQENGNSWSRINIWLCRYVKSGSSERVYTTSIGLYLSFRWSTYYTDPTSHISLVQGNYNDSWYINQGQGSVPIDNIICREIATCVEGMTFTKVGTRMYYGYDTNDGLWDQMTDFIESHVDDWVHYAETHNWYKWSRSTYSSKREEVSSPKLLTDDERFVLCENYIIQQGIDPYLLPRHGLPNYWRNVLVQQAYLDCLNSVPTLNDNSISNVIEIAGFIKSLVIDKKVELPKSLGDAWLSYRYAYTTSKLDAQEAIEFVHRHMDLGTLNQWIHCFGQSSITYHSDLGDIPISCRCGLWIHPREVSKLQEIWRALYTYGLQPNFYTVWDMVPYSFIIDWLVPVGNLAHAIDARANYNGTYYDIRSVCFSLSYDIEDEYQNRYHQYTRWASNGVPELNGFYFLEEDPASTKVKGMRALDAMSLFIGKG